MVTGDYSGLTGQSWTDCPAVWLLDTSASFVDIYQEGGRALSHCGVRVPHLQMRQLGHRERRCLWGARP